MQSIFTRKALPAFTVCVSSSLAFGHSFTNHAGHAVSGELTSISNNIAVISGRRIPLSAFTVREQERMREMLSLPAPLPSALAASRRSLCERWLRKEALLKAGELKEADAAAQRVKLANHWRRMLDAEPSLTPADREYWSSRLFD